MLSPHQGRHGRPGLEQQIDFEGGKADAVRVREKLGFTGWPAPSILVVGRRACCHRHSILRRGLIALRSIRMILAAGAGRSWASQPGWDASG
jgi:hypothetical protein